MIFKVKEDFTKANSLGSFSLNDFGVRGIKS